MALYLMMTLTIIYRCSGSIGIAENHYIGDEIKNPTSVMQLIPLLNDCKFWFKNQTFGVIASPRYPLDYPRNISCEWRIETEKNSRIVLTVKQFFLSLGDQLLINNGRKTHTYNLQNPPNDILFLDSSNATLSLKSRSNSNFIVNQNASNNEHQRIFYAMFESERCGGVLTEEAGYITIPQYIHTSDRPRECIWSIISTKNKVITLDFIQFDVQPGSCIYNNVYVRDGDKTGGYTMGDFCEENPPLSQLRTTTNTMTISYRMRPNLYKRKLEYLPSIRMFYRIVDNCGGELEGYSGSFVTPKQWPEGLFTCNWTITVPQGKQIILKIRKWTRATVNKDLIQNQDEAVKVIDLNNPHQDVWEYKGGVQYPPESIQINNNRVRIIWSSNPERQTGVHPLLYFQGFYETITREDGKHCVVVGNEMLFLCEENDYIDCSKRCDDVIECANGNDERNCPRASFDDLTSSSLDALSNKHRFDLINKKTNRSSYFTILLISSAGVLALVLTSIILVDRFLKTTEKDEYRSVRQQSDDYSNPQYEDFQPPPYKEVDDSSLILMAEIQQPPPPYYTFETTSEGTANSVISRSSFTPSALFHDTDMMDISTGTDSYSPAPFRYTDDQDDHEEFLKEIETLKED